MMRGKLVLVADDDPLIQTRLLSKCPSDGFCPDYGSGCRLKLGPGMSSVRSRFLLPEGPLYRQRTLRMTAS